VDAAHREQAERSWDFDEVRDAGMARVLDAVLGVGPFSSLCVDLLGLPDGRLAVAAHRVVRRGDVRRADFAESVVAEPRDEEAADAVPVVGDRALTQFVALDAGVEPARQPLGEGHPRIERAVAGLEVAERLGAGVDSVLRRCEAALHLTFAGPVGTAW
jgi:hypothetical protein